MTEVAYALADHIQALWESENVRQNTFAMEPMEFRDFIASQLAGVLNQYGPNGMKRRGRPGPVNLPVQTRKGGEDDATAPDHITGSAAAQILENAPKPVRLRYRELRDGGATPVDALNSALALLREMQDAAAFVQCFG